MPVPDRDAAAALVDRIVAAAQIPGRARREALRRELRSHFEDAGASPESERDAMRRFGDEAAIADWLRRVHRRDRALLSLARIAASVAAAIAAALLIEAIVNLRVEPRAGMWRLAPPFAHTAMLSAAVAVALAAAREAGRRPFSAARIAAAASAYAIAACAAQILVAGGATAFVEAAALVALGSICSRLAPDRARAPLMVASFAAAVAALHALRDDHVAARGDVVSGAALAAVWASTLVILARMDAAFDDRFA